jgi:hypothetical protein
VVCAMNNHKGHPFVQRDGCAALGNLAVQSRLVIRQKGGIQAVVCAMLNHKGLSKLQVYGC